MFCSQCGERQVDGGRYCGKCGAVLVESAHEPVGATQPQAASVSQAARPAAATTGVGPGQVLTTTVDWRSDRQYADRPAEIWAVVGLIGLATVILAWPAFRLIDAGSDLMAFSGGLGFAVVVLGLLLLMLAAALGSVAYLVHRGDPESWVLALVAAGLIVGQILWVLFSSGVALDTSTVLLILLAVAWSGVLVLLPTTHEWFAAREAERPLSVPLDVAVGRRLCWALIVLAGLNAFALVLLAITLGDVGGSTGRAWLAGLLLAGAAVGFFLGARRLARPTGLKQARLVVTGAAVAAVLGTLTWHEYGAQVNALLFGLAIATAALLWARPPVRQYFDAQA